MATKDALLQTPGSVGTFLQHSYVVIGLEYKHIGGASAFADQPCHVPQIGGKPDIPTAGSEHETDGVLCVVRNGKSFHGNIPHIKATATDKQAEIQIRSERTLDFVHRGSIAINWNAQLFRDTDKTRDVIAMLVGNQNSRQVFRCASDTCEAQSNLARAEPGIDQNARLVGFDVRSITGRTATENREFHCHAETLTTVSKLDNAIKRVSALTIQSAPVSSIYENHPAALPVCNQRLRSAIQ